MIGEDWQFVAENIAYIRDEAEREPVAFRSLVEDGYARLVELTDGLTDAQIAFRPASDARSILEVVQHVATYKRWAAKVCTLLSQGKTPDADPGAPLTDGDSTMTGVLLELEAAHERMADFAHDLWPMTDLTTRWAMPGMPPLNCKEWAIWQRAHDRHHDDEIAAIQESFGYPAHQEGAKTRWRSVA